MARAKRSEAARFTAVIAPDSENGGFVVTFPALPSLPQPSRRRAALCKR